MSSTAIVFPLQRGGSFGDLLVQCPFLHALKASLGAQRVVVIAPHDFVRLVAELGLADAVHVIPDEDVAAIRDVIRDEAPRWAFTLRRSSLRATWLTHRCRGATRVGWRSLPNRLLLDHTARKDRDEYYALVFGRLLEAVGARVDIAATGAALARSEPGDELPPGTRRLVCMPAGKVAGKQWGVDNYRALGEHLAAHWAPLERLAILGPREAELAPAFERDGWRCLVAPAPTRIVALCREATCIVANDCGPGHLAQMAARPMVILYHNAQGRAQREGLLRLWWWRRPHSRAISTAEPGPIEAVPSDYVAQVALEAVADATEPDGPLWWAP